MTVFLFSGQGSQYYHMGRGLFESNRSFRESMIRLDEQVRQTLGISIISELYSDRHSKADAFGEILETHPAIFMVEYSVAHTLIDAGVTPDIVVGASLGLFAAAAVSGRVNAEDALALVMKQAEAIAENCEPGGMIAILADPSLSREDFLYATGELAALNFNGHFVISARARELPRIENELRRRDIGFQRLPVGFAFHSRWIDQARTPFLRWAQPPMNGPGRLPLVCCSGADYSSNLPNDCFWQAVRRPVQFQETLCRMTVKYSCRYIDAGPAGTMATFLRYCLPNEHQSTIHAVLTPYGLDQRNLDTVISV